MAIVGDGLERLSATGRSASPGPLPGPAGRLAAGLALAYVLSRDPASAFTTAARKRSPELTGAADALIEAGVFAMAASGMTWAQAAPKLLAAV